MFFPRSSIQFTCVFASGILLLIFCCRVWGIGPTHTDDAVWHLAALQGKWEVVNDWAINQGRFFAYVSGSLIYFGNMFQGTNAGSFMQLGSLTCFFFLFHYVIGLFFNKNIALLAACLNLALFSLRWDGSIVTTYPLYFWVLGSIFLLAILALRRFSQSGQGRWLWAYSLFLFVSLNIHEGASVLLAMLALMVCFYDSRLWQAFSERGHVGLAERILKLIPQSSDKRQRMQLCVTVGTIALYFACFVAWRLAYPSKYSGNSLGSLSPLTFLPLVLNLSLNGNVIGELFGPYRVGFADAVSGDGYGVVYRTSKFLFSSDSTTIGCITAVLVGSQVFALLHSSQRDESKNRLPIIGGLIAVGLLIAFIPVAPVSLSNKYQNEFYSLGVAAHCYTPLCHFGWSILLAGGMWWSATHFPWPRSRGIASIATAVLIGIVAFGAAKRNDAVAADMRRETCRWQIAQQVNNLLEATDKSVECVCIPQFASGSWFTVVPESYWEKYFATRFNRQVDFCSTPLSDRDLQAGVMLVQYEPATWTSDSWAIGTVLERRESRLQELITREVVVSTSGLSPSKLNQLQLRYHDSKEDTPELVRVSQLPESPKNKSVRKLQNIAAVPDTITLSQFASVSRVPIMATVLDGKSVRFGTAPTGGRERLFGNHWLSSNEWHLPEGQGVWSKCSASKISVPLDSSEELGCKLRLSTLTGLGHSDIPQRVTIALDGREPIYLDFKQGDGFKDAYISIENYSIARQTLVIDISVPPLTPSEIGISSDTRVLGVFVQSIELCDRREDHITEVAELPSRQVN